MPLSDAFDHHDYPWATDNAMYADYSFQASDPAESWSQFYEPSFDRITDGQSSNESTSYASSTDTGTSHSEMYSDGTMFFNGGWRDYLPNASSHVGDPRNDGTEEPSRTQDVAASRSVVLSPSHLAATRVTANSQLIEPSPFSSSASASQGSAAGRTLASPVLNPQDVLEVLPDPDLLLGPDNWWSDDSLLPLSSAGFDLSGRPILEHDPLSAHFDTSLFVPDNASTLQPEDGELGEPSGPERQTFPSESVEAATSSFPGSSTQVQTTVSSPASSSPSIRADDAGSDTSVEIPLIRTTALLDLQVPPNELAESHIVPVVRSGRRQSRAATAGPHLLPLSSDSKSESSRTVSRAQRTISTNASSFKKKSSSKKPSSKKKKKQDPTALDSIPSIAAQPVELCGYMKPGDPAYTCGATASRASDMARHRQIHLFDEWVARNELEGSQGVFAQWEGEFPRCPRCRRAFARISARDRHWKGKTCARSTVPQVRIASERPTQYWVLSPVERPKKASARVGRPHDFGGTKGSYVLEIVDVLETYDNRYIVRETRGQEIDVEFLTRDRPGGQTWYSATASTGATSAPAVQPHAKQSVASRKKRSRDDEDDEDGDARARMETGDGSGGHAKQRDTAAAPTRPPKKRRVAQI